MALPIHSWSAINSINFRLSSGVTVFGILRGVIAAVAPVIGRRIVASTSRVLFVAKTFIILYCIPIPLAERTDLRRRHRHHMERER